MVQLHTMRVSYSKKKKNGQEGNDEQEEAGAHGQEGSNNESTIHEGTSRQWLLARWVSEEINRLRAKSTSKNIMLQIWLGILLADVARAAI